MGATDMKVCLLLCVLTAVVNLLSGHGGFEMCLFRDTFIELDSGMPFPVFAARHVWMNGSMMHIYCMICCCLSTGTLMYGKKVIQSSIQCSSFLHAVF